MASLDLRISQIALPHWDHDEPAEYITAGRREIVHPQLKKADSRID